jgi:hypothetical protein
MATESSPLDLAPDEPQVDLDEFKRTAKRRSYIAIVLALILFVNAGLMWGANIWSALISLLIGATQLIIAVTLIPRVGSRNDIEGAGNVVVQHSWLLLSVGLAALALYPSPFFAMPAIWFWIAMLAGFAWMLLGMINLYQAISQTGARATI